MVRRSVILFDSTRSHCLITEFQWYRQKLYLYGGKYTDLDDFLRSEWEAGFLANWDANDMLTLLRTWQMGDISKVSSVGSSLQGDLAGVLKTITAKGLIMPCKTDLYFPASSSLPCQQIGGTETLALARG